MLGLQLAIARPSPRRDLLAVGALALAVLARTQFAALALVLPLAIVGHEIGYARSVRGGLREAFGRHRLLAGIYALGAVVLLVAALVDSVGGLLGVYAVTVEEGALLPSGIWSSAAEHVDAVAIGCGLVPFVVGGGWLLATAVRPRSRPEHAFATLALLTTLVLTFEVASFSVRFGDDAVRDRYLFYVVPLLLAATAAALSSARARDVAIGAAAVTAFFAGTAAGLSFETFTGVWIDSPASVLNDLLGEQSGGLGTGAFVALLGLFVGIVLVLALLFVPRLPLAVVVVGALALFSILTLRSEVDRVVGSTGLSGRPLAEAPGTRARLGGRRRARRRGGGARVVSRLDRVGHDGDPLVGRRALEPPARSRVRRPGRQLRVHAVLPRRARDRREDRRGLRRRRTSATRWSRHAIPASSSRDERWPRTSASKCARSSARTGSCGRRAAFRPTAGPPPAGRHS